MNKNENIDIIKKEVKKIKEKNDRKNVMLKMFIEILFMTLVTFCAYSVNNIFLEKITDKDVMLIVICWVLIFAVGNLIIFVSNVNIVRKFSIFILSIFNGILLNDIIGYLMGIPLEKVITKEIIIIVIITLIFLGSRCKGILKFIIIIAAFILAKLILFEAIISFGELSIIAILYLIGAQKYIIENYEEEIYVIKADAIEFQLFIYVCAILMLFCSV